MRQVLLFLSVMMVGLSSPLPSEEANQAIGRDVEGKENIALEQLNPQIKQWLETNGYLRDRAFQNSPRAAQEFILETAQQELSLASREDIFLSQHEDFYAAPVQPSSPFNQNGSFVENYISQDGGNLYPATQTYSEDPRFQRLEDDTSILALNAVDDFDRSLKGNPDRAAVPSAWTGISMVATDAEPSAAIISLLLSGKPFRARAVSVAGELDLAHSLTKGAEICARRMIYASPSDEDRYARCAKTGASAPFHGQ